MEQQNSYIAAIDIGTTKIVAVIGRVKEDLHSGKKVEVVSYGIAPAEGMKRGVIFDLQKVTRSIAIAAQKAKFKEEFDVSEVYIGLSGYSIRSTVVNHHKLLPNGIITQQDIDNLTLEIYKTAVSEGEEILHVIPHSYIIDENYVHPNPIGLAAKRLEGNFYLIISEKTLINNIKNAVKNAGFEIKKVIFEPLASAEAVLTNEEKEAGVALLDIGGGTTDLVVYHDHNLIFSKVIPFGGNTITDDIKTALQILKEQAEEIKIKYGTAISQKKLENEIIKIEGIAGRPPKKINARHLAIIIQTRITEIIDAAYAFIKEYHENKKLAAGITLTGGGSLLKDLATLVKYRTGLEIRVAAPELSDVPELNDPKFATTIGLIIKGHEYETQFSAKGQSNNSQVRRKKQEKKTKSKFLSNLKEIWQQFTKDPEE